LIATSLHVDAKISGNQEQYRKRHFTKLEIGLGEKQTY